MDKRTYYKYLFFADAAKAWILAISALIMDLGGLTGAGRMYFHGFMICVLVVGLGYFIIGLDIDKNHGLVITSIAAQSSVFILFTYYGALGIAVGLQIGAGILDLIFAILFIEFLINYKKLPPRS